MPDINSLESYFQGKRVDRSSPIALYEQLRRILLAAISHGEFSPGTQMPGERELEQYFQVSRITVRRALGDLVTSGYLRREPGRGTFVIRSVIDDSSKRRLGGLVERLKAQGRDVSSRILLLEWQEPSEKVAKILDLAPNTSVLRFNRLHIVERVPTVLIQHWLKLLPKECDELSMELLERMSLWDALEQRCSIRCTHGEQILQAVGANAMESELLEVPLGTPLMLIELIVDDARGNTVAYLKVAYRGSDYKLHMPLNFA